MRQAEPNKAIHRMSGAHICSRFGWLWMPLIGDLCRSAGGATAKAHQPQRGDMFIARPYRNLRKPRRGGMVLPRTGQCRPYGACGKDRGRGGHYKHVAPTELAQPSSCTGRLDSVSVDCWTSLARRQFIRVFPCLCGLAAYPVRHEANAIMSKKANPFPLLENMTVTLMRHN